MKRTAGFTLVEILVVMAIISVLMGFGIGMFQSLGAGGKFTQADATVRGTIRAVRYSSQSWPAALAVDTERNMVYGLEFRTVASCSFEAPVGDDTTQGVIGLSYKHGTIRGDGSLKPYPFGHTGGGLGFQSGGTVDFGNYSEYDLTEGVSLSIWVYPTENAQMDLLRKGNSYGIRLRRGPGAPIVEGFLNLDESVGGQTRGARQAYLVPDRPLTLNRWNRVVMNYDRTAVSIAVDSFGRGPLERLRQSESRKIVPDNEAQLTVGGQDGPIVGRVDDMMVAGILAGAERTLPTEVTLKPRGPKGEIKTWQIRMRDGKLDPEFHRAAASIFLLFSGQEYEVRVNLMGEIEK
jgi:prepilin-type N-terminal cleavage/methylation domain-containing protein